MPTRAIALLVAVACVWWILGAPGSESAPAEPSGPTESREASPALLVPPGVSAPLRPAPIGTVPLEPDVVTAAGAPAAAAPVVPQWKRAARRRLIRKASRLSGLESGRIEAFLARGGDPEALEAAVRAVEQELFRLQGSLSLGTQELHRDWTSQNLTERTPLTQQTDPPRGRSIEVDGTTYRWERPIGDHEEQRVVWDILRIDGLPFLNVSRIDPGDDAGHDARAESCRTARDRIRRGLSDRIASPGR